MVMSDRRINKTKLAITNAFFKLLKNEPADKITIKAICELADINRSTFYRNYADYPDFLEKLQNKVAEKVLDVFYLYQFDSDCDETVDGIFDTIKNNPNLFAFLFQEDLCKKPKEICFNAIKEKTIPDWLANSNMSQVQAEILFTYTINGQYGVLKMWYDSGFKIKENIIKDIYINVINYGILYYIHRK